MSGQTVPLCLMCWVGFFWLDLGFSFGSGFLGWVEFWVKIRVKVGSSQDRVGSGHLSRLVPDPCLVSGRVSLFDVSGQIFFRLGRVFSGWIGFRSKITTHIWSMNYYGSKIMVRTGPLHWSGRVGSDQVFSVRSC
jgi:hypothetical protein